MSCKFYSNSKNAMNTMFSKIEIADQVFNSENNSLNIKLLSTVAAAVIICVAILATLTMKKEVTLIMTFHWSKKKKIDFHLLL